ncbi:MAG: hypothetical protein K2P17_00880 [Helicobacteraceae bacterium]|nr:hypothetical protein [Helicobacteraceae bacterium]
METIRFSKKDIDRLKQGLKIFLNNIILKNEISQIQDIKFEILKYLKVLEEYGFDIKISFGIRDFSYKP